jgi:hypothetical protein
VTSRDQGLHATAPGNIKGSPNELPDTGVVDRLVLQADPPQQPQGISLVPSLSILPRQCDCRSGIGCGILDRIGDQLRLGKPRDF